MTATGEPVGSPERLFLEHLEVIDQILETIARRNALTQHDADDFAAWARARLIGDDYRVFRKFEGRSSLSTYLTVVLTRLCGEYRNSIWGRWRPSAAAQRMGPTGIRLEQLIVRDGCPPREAVAILRSAGVAATDAELRRMVAALPLRPIDRDVPLDDVSYALSDRAPAHPTDREERERVVMSLRTAIEAFPEEDRLITRMRFWDGLSIADIARILRLEQKPLYRRLEGIQRRLKDALERDGITDEVARELLREEGSW